MELQVIATRDIVSNVYSQPMFVIHIGQAIRGFGDECTGKGQSKELAMHPGDYELWHLGTYEDTTATFKIFPMEERKQLAVGANYRQQ